MSLPVKASFWYLFASVLQKGISLITTPIFTRVLTTREYGVVSIYASWEAILTIFATLYLHQGVYNNGMAKFRSKRDEYNLTMQTTSSALTVALLVIYLFGHNTFNTLMGLTTNIMLLMFVDIFFSTAVSFWSIRNRYEFKYKSVVIVTIVTSVLSTLLSLVLVFILKEARAEAKILGQIIVRVVIYSFIYYINIKRGKKLFNSHFAKYALAFNIPLLPHYLSTMILNQSDRIMISNMVGLSEAGIYSLAYNAAMLMTIVTTSLNNSFAPWMYEEIAANRFKNIGKSAIKIIILVGFLCLAVVLFAPEIITILGSKEYGSAIWVIPPTAMSVLFIFVYCCFANLEFYYEKKKFILIGSLMSAIFNLSLNAIFIPMFGFVAAGYTTLASYIVFTVFHYVAMTRTCKEKNVENPYNGILLLVVCGGYVVLALVCNALYLNSSVRYATVVILAVVVIIVGVKYKNGIINVFRRKR